jgi:hypothetical protein
MTRTLQHVLDYYGPRHATLGVHDGRRMELVLEHELGQEPGIVRVVQGLGHRVHDLAEAGLGVGDDDVPQRHRGDVLAPRVEDVEAVHDLGLGLYDLSSAIASPTFIDWLKKT